MIKKIAFIDFSIASISGKISTNNNQGINYIDTQKEVLVQYLTSNKNLFLEIFCLNTKFSIIKEKIGNYNFIRLPYLYNDYLSLIFFNFFSLTFLVKNKPDICYIYSSRTPFFSFGALLYAKITRKKFFLNIRNPPSIASTNENNKYFKYPVSLIENIFFNLSDVIIHISEKSRVLFKSKNRIFNKSIVMGSCPNKAFFKIRNEILNIKDINFFYWGIIDKKRDLGTPIRGFIKAKEYSKDFKGKLYIIGVGNDLIHLKTQFENRDDIIFSGFFTQEKICEFLKQNAIAVIPIPPEQFFQYSAPLKLSEAIAAGLPMIATDIEPHRIITEYDLGILCSHSIDSYADSFIKFMNMSESELQRYSNNSLRVNFLVFPEYILSDVMQKILE